MTALKQVRVLTTGGTIEKSYCESAGELGNFRSLFEDKILKSLRLPGVDLKLSEVLAKDSLNMTAKDRQHIWTNISQALQKDQCPIIVLHGTDTMDITMNHINSMCHEPSHPIVFTGAMKPVDVLDSDAIQNFTESLLATQFLTPGIYLVFHGQVFKANEFKKNRALGSFEAIPAD